MPYSEFELIDPNSNTSSFELVYSNASSPARVHPLTIGDCFSIAAFTKKSYDVKRIIFNDPATIVFWEDGTKTVVKTMKGDKYNKYFGFLAALAKKVYGSNTEVQKIIEKKGEETAPKDIFDSPDIFKALDRWLAKEKQVKERQEK